MSELKINAASIRVEDMIGAGGAVVIVPPPANNNVNLQAPIPTLPATGGVIPITATVNGGPKIYADASGNIAIVAQTGIDVETQGLQDVITKNNVLTKDNTIDQIGHWMQWDFIGGVSHLFWGGATEAQTKFEAFFQSGTVSYGAITADTTNATISARNNTANVTRVISAGQTELLFQSDRYKLGLVYGYASGPGFVWTDVAGNGVMTLQPLPAPIPPPPPQGLQDVIDTDNVLDKDNNIDMAGHWIEWDVDADGYVFWGPRDDTPYLGNVGFEAFFQNPDGGYGSVISDKYRAAIGARNGTTGQVRFLYVNQDEFFMQSDKYRFETIGYPTGAGYVWTDVNGDGRMTLQAPTGGGGGGTVTIYSEVTKAALDSMIVNSTLVPGMTYKVTGVDVPLYGGTSVILTALSNNKISTLGHGLFYNPKYNQANANTGIWTAGATYAIGAKVAWGNKMWVNATGAAGSAANDFTLNAPDWTSVADNETDYNLVADPIEYDYAHDWIMKRSDNIRNSVVGSWGSFSAATNPIKYMQWGNPATAAYIGCSNNTIIDSDVRAINQKGYFVGNVFKDFSTFTGNTIVQGGYVFENVVDQQSTMNNNTFGVNAQVSTNTLNNFCAINGNVITGGYLLNNVLEIAGTINNNTFNGNGQIRQNRVMGGSQINGNTLGAYSVIWRNTIGHASYINSNNISAGNATFFAYIYRNEIYEGMMNSNTITGPNAAISHNYLRGGMFTPVGILSEISNCQITTTATQIKYNTLDRASIKNVICTNHNFTNGRFENVAYDGGSIVSSGLVDSLELTSKKYLIPMTVVFTGGAGTGSIGGVTLPVFRIPAGYFIEEVLVEVTSPLTDTGVGAIINLGIATDGVSSGLNNTTGVIATLNAAGITRYQVGTFGFVKALAARTVVMSVNSDTITGGTIFINVRLSKLT